MHAPAKPNPDSLRYQNNKQIIAATSGATLKPSDEPVYEEVHGLANENVERLDGSSSENDSSHVSVHLLNVGTPGYLEMLPSDSQTTNELKSLQNDENRAINYTRETMQYANVSGENNMPASDQSESEN